METETKALAECNGVCLMAYEILEGGTGVAYPDPTCDRHGSRAVAAEPVGGDWNVTYGPSVPTAVPRRRKRDPHCAECGRSTDARFGGHHPGCPNG